ncbi:hypothetical protein ASG83_00400 [Yonghaparkia sp. Soil809]|nr:hypothetical protein ASG83_00400 [Yonghaparkia sp. Soil809]
MKAVTRVAACPNCASPLRDGLRFCTQCGTALLTAPAISAPAPAVDAVPAPVPALGPGAPEPVARPSILGLLVSPSPASVEAEDAEEDDDAREADTAEPEAPPEPAEPAVPVAPLHPLGVPVISARQPPRPGANPTHIGRARSYITAPPAPVASATSAEPASAPLPTADAAAARIPSPPAAVVSGSSAASGATAPSASTAPSAPSPSIDQRPAGRTSGRRYSPPPVRSTAASWALVTGLLPLLVSIFGNAVTTELGTEALEATASGVTSGAWAPVFVALSLVFVANAALLTVCAITGVRGIRETSNGITRGRPLAVSGLAAGAVNVVLLVAGLVISISGLSAVLA